MSDQSTWPVLDAGWDDHDDRCCMKGFPDGVPPHPECPGYRVLSPGVGDTP